jgi:hypothetical protein
VQKIRIEASIVILNLALIRIWLDSLGWRTLWRTLGFSVHAKIVNIINTYGNLVVNLMVETVESNFAYKYKTRAVVSPKLADGSVLRNYFKCNGRKPILQATV